MLHGVEWVTFEFPDKGVAPFFWCHRCSAVRVAQMDATFGAVVREGCDFARQHKECSGHSLTQPRLP